MGSTKILRAIGILIAATGLGVSGDATVRIALHNHAGVMPLRIGLFAVAAIFLLGYGSFLNLAPFEFCDVVGLYIATLFIVWQVINFAFLELCPRTDPGWRPSHSWRRGPHFPLKILN